MWCEDLPDGFSMDPESRSISSEVPVDWHITDLYHPYYDGHDRYRGESIRDTDIITLSPGRYEIVSCGESFVVLVRGSMDFDASWRYDDGSAVHDVGLEYTIDFDDFMDSADRSRLFNTSSSYRFDSLTDLVEVGDTIASIERSLSSEYQRIGGSVSDRQGYADFIASFVQLTIVYPSTIPGHSGAFDYSLYGKSEYWATPLETLYYGIGDCEDTSALLCALYEAAGYRSAMGGISGHVFAGVALDTYEQSSEERLKSLDPYRSYRPAVRTMSVDDTEVTFYAVETIYDQVPAGYLTSGDMWFDMNTQWGISGFYPVAFRSG